MDRFLAGAMIVVGVGGAIVCVAVIVRAVFLARAKRRRLAAAYDTVSRTAAEPLLEGQPVVSAAGGRVRGAASAFAPQVWPPRVRPAGDGGPFKRRPEQEPLRPAYSSRKTDTPRTPYTAPTFPADPSPVVYGDPVSLSSTSFEGDGGSFGGAGASGGWDAPAAPDPSPTPDPPSFDGGSSDSGVSSGD